MIRDPATFLVLSNVFTSLAAAWFAAVFIIPAGTRRKVDPIVLANNIGMGIVYVLIAIALAKQVP